VADLRVVTALRLEALAVGGAVTVVGAGRERAAAWRPDLDGRRDDVAVGVVGVAGALQEDLQPGDLVVATELRTIDGKFQRRLPHGILLAGELRRNGLSARTGTVASAPTFVPRARRRALAGNGAVAVDMESAWLAGALADRPVAVIRSIADTIEHGPVRGGLRALASLRRTRSVLEAWARALGRRQVVLAAPRSFCAGVERAIEIVERALERSKAPVYVRRQIVHNAHVVRDLESKGAVFVEEISEVPDGATVVLAAHGVSRAVREEAARRGDLTVIDATCPLVAKVHHEARRYAERGHQIVLVGHGDHEEVIGTMGEVPGRIRLVESVDDVEALDLAPDEPVAYLTQTTLATDETAEVIAALQERYPRLVGPSADDICYATQNRQDAVRAVARRCDLMLVVGSENSSNTLRLVEVANRQGCRAELIEDVSQLQLSWLNGARTVGITAGASAPDALVHETVEVLAALGDTSVTEHRTTQETVRFALPAQVR